MVQRGGVSVSVLFSEPKIPQLRAASVGSPDNARRFSALQRAENSSILGRVAGDSDRPTVSVLFSEPKIPQLTIKIPQFRWIDVSVLFSEPKIPQLTIKIPQFRWIDVSVLFSEPKIPQSFESVRRGHPPLCFSALQRAENSSMIRPPARPEDSQGFSALQRAENSSIRTSVRFA